MRASDLASRLQHLIRLHGDAEVYIDADETGLREVGEVDVDAEDTGVIIWLQEPQGVLVHCPACGHIYTANGCDECPRCMHVWAETPL